LNRYDKYGFLFVEFVRLCVLGTSLSFFILFVFDLRWIFCYFYDYDCIFVFSFVLYFVFAWCVGGVSFKETYYNFIDLHRINVVVCES